MIIYDIFYCCPECNSLQLTDLRKNFDLPNLDGKTVASFFGDNIPSDITNVLGRERFCSGCLKSLTQRLSAEDLYIEEPSAMRN